jgi:DNA-binding transcriptional LysR family regulator
MNRGGVLAFLAIVQCNGVSRAAERLHLTQSSISKRLHQLEEELGVILIDRDRGIKFIQLTPEGEMFLGIAERWMTLHQEALAISSRAKHLSLRVGSITSINYEFLHNIFQKLILHEPSVQLSICSGLSYFLYEKIEQRIIDVGFTRLVRASDVVVSRQLYSDGIVGLCLASSPLAGKKKVTINELNADQEILPAAGEAFRIWHNKLWPAYAPKRVNVDNFDTMLGLLCTPEQWSLVTSRVAQTVCRQKRFASFTLADPGPERACYMITHKNPRKNLEPALKILMEVLGRELNLSL